jgi:hypothetical protein
MFDLNFYNSLLKFKNNGEELSKFRIEMFKGSHIELRKLRERIQTLKLAQNMIIGSKLLDYIGDWCDYFDINFDELIK